MPDSQGPQYGSKPTLTGAGVSGPRISPSDVFSPWHKSRERNYQCPLGALIIPLPHVFPPTYVGFGISYILGNLIKAKIIRKIKSQRQILKTSLADLSFSGT